MFYYIRVCFFIFLKCSDTCTLILPASSVVHLSGDWPCEESALVDATLPLVLHDYIPRPSCILYYQHNHTKSYRSPQHPIKTHAQAYRMVLQCIKDAWSQLGRCFVKCCICLCCLGDYGPPSNEDISSNAYGLVRSLSTMRSRRRHSNVLLRIHVHATGTRMSGRPMPRQPRITRVIDSHRTSSESTVPSVKPHSRMVVVAVAARLSQCACQTHGYC